jgi:LuxR family maltose regulon positive regulatory protein
MDDHQKNSLQYSLLTTKLFIPEVQKTLVQRARLTNLLNEGFNKKLILISAPAGFGKTTILCDWIHQSRIPIAWYTVDENDNTPQQFLFYLISALQRIDSSVGQSAVNIIKSPQPSPINTILVGLINDIASIKSSFAIILDDYHSMGDKRINDIISFIVEHQPKQLHLIVSTRSDPSLPLARLRSQNQITEIRAADLSFNMVESAIFLNERLELELSPDEIELLKSKTEGWIAGLQLAALSVKGRSDKSDFIKSFTGDNRYVVDYLIEEVLNRQSKTIQNFLQNSCILDRLTGSLCNDLTEQTNSSEILQTLERANLFIFPLDNQRKWYRYHHLFSDLLRKRLKLMDLDRLFSLHKKACQWYLKHQMKDEAINHAIAAKDFEIAAKLIEDIAEIDWDRGQESQLLKWFRRLPEELISSSPHLSIFHARELFESAQPEEAEERLKNAEFLLQKETIPEKARKSIKGRIAVIRGVMASYRGDIPNIIKYIGQALELLSDEELMWKSVAATTLGFAYGWSGEGDMRKAHKAFSEAREISIKADNIYFNIFAGSCIAVVEVKQGNLKTAIQMHTHLLELSKERGMWQVGPVGSIFSALGNILCEKNEVKKGIENIKKGIELSTLGQDPLALTGCNFHLVRSLLFQKDYKGAQNVILKIDHTAQHFEMPPWMLSTLEALRVYTWLGLGKIKLVQDWINKRKLSIEDAIHQQREAE